MRFRTCNEVAVNSQNRFGVQFAPGMRAIFTRNKIIASFPDFRVCSCAKVLPLECTKSDKITPSYPLNSYLRRANLHASKPVRMLIFTWERKLYLQSRGCSEPHRYIASRHPPRSGKLGCFCKKRNQIETKPKQTAPLMCAGGPAGGSGGCGFLCR